MYSHFSVILLCFTGVYCISSLIENLDLNKLRMVYGGPPIMVEWKTAMDQPIYYGKDDNDSKITVNVRSAVEDIMEKDDSGDVNDAEFQTIRDQIKIAYQCTLAKYASLTAYLIVQELRTLKIYITVATVRMERDGLEYDSENIFKIINFLRYFAIISKKQYHFDFDVKFRGRDFQILAPHEFESSPSKEWQNVWATMIEKALGFKIKYKIYPDVFRKQFTNERGLPDVHVINEIVCILNEAIQLFDNFVVDNCAQHHGIFLNNFQSLRKGVHNDLTELLNYFDNKKAESPVWALYRDYSIPLPGTSQTVNEIRGSGGFVENVEFEISGLKMDFPNNTNPTEIYGDLDHESTSEAVLSFKETTAYRDYVVKVCKVLFRDAESGLVEEDTPPSILDILIEY